MTSRANPLRGEALLPIGGETCRLRPTFDALVAAEEELGPLLALVERAGEGRLRLCEMASLFWFCCEERETVSRESVGRAVMALGIAACAPILRTLLGEILRGSG